MVSTKPLKAFALRTLNGYPLTQRVILGEPDELSAQEFVVKSGVWLRSLEAEMSGGGSGNVR